ncbi:MarR family winged helix-turn-helix transcriptional regulator [Oryzihumus sp.]|uniref:MarR family winged helix-turn-helix transcriptional regulator n=1 Tax=Oryzihumus sp. TaxID=1968903 RepID=UPI002EDAEF3B
MSETGPLSEDEQRTWGAFSALLDLMSSALDAGLHERGLNLFSYAVLSALADQPDRTLRMSELAALTHASASRLSHMVRRLEDKGWVERSPAHADGRGNLAHLTDQGLQTVRLATPDHVTAVRTLVFDPLDGAGREQLHALSCRLVQQFGVSLPACE